VVNLLSKKIKELHTSMPWSVFLFPAVFVKTMELAIA
jgi:hypothetical protein